MFNSVLRQGVVAEMASAVVFLLRASFGCPSVPDVREHSSCYPGRDPVAKVVERLHNCPSRPIGGGLPGRETQGLVKCGVVQGPSFHFVSNPGDVWKCHPGSHDVVNRFLCFFLRVWRNSFGLLGSADGAMIGMRLRG